MKKVIGVVWDYDGTIVNTNIKNFAVQKKLVPSITGKPENAFPALRSIKNYQLMQSKITNWRDQYRDYFNMSEREINEAGKLWAKLQSTDKTDTPIYFGLAEVFEKLKNIPQGIFSQNSKRQIQETLENKNVLQYFSVITGFEELADNEQKPAPAGLIKVLNNLIEKNEGIFLFVGDHTTDFKCADNTNNYLRINNSGISIRSVGVNYTPESDPEKWEIKPDYILDNPSQIIKIIRKINMDSNKDA